MKDNIKIFCLLTDFGLDDMYVGQVKGVILQNIPNANIIDLSHNILPHNILQGSFYLTSSWPYLPDNSITIVVVDPGVGSSRDILIMDSGEKIVIAPDNGILYPLIEKYSFNFKLYSLNFEGFYNRVSSKEVSSTFHGRDIFAPLGVYTALGYDIKEISKEIHIDKIKRLQFPRIDFNENKIEFQIIHIDRFGNCVTNIEEKYFDMLCRKNLTLKPYGKRLYLVESYSYIQGEEIGLIKGSQGYLELCLFEKSFAKKYKVNIGDKFKIEID